MENKSQTTKIQSKIHKEFYILEIYTCTMYECSRCHKEFQFLSKLKEHNNRKTLCPLQEKVHQCHFCLKKMKSERNLETHLQKCKWENDPIRILENKLKIVIEPLYETKTCRFCNKSFSINHETIRHMKQCKEKEKYEQMLIQRLEDKNKNKTVTLKEKKEIIYICKLREFVRSNEDIYKIGRTVAGFTEKGSLKRMGGYPKGSELKSYFYVHDCVESEKYILKELKERYGIKKEYGKEFFEAPLYELICFIDELLKEQIY